MYVRKSLAAIIVSLSCVGNADASLRPMDLNQVGDQLLTLDEKTGLEWLDLTQSVYTNSVIIAREMQPGGRFEGFQWANMAQVKTLFADGGWNGEWGKVDSASGRENARNLVTLLGATASLGEVSIGPQAAIGRVADVLIGPGVTTSIRVEYDFSNPYVPQGDAFYSVSPYTIDNGSPAIGAFLYRPAAPIPEPSTVNLLFVGLSTLALRLFNRRRQ